MPAKYSALCVSVLATAGKKLGSAPARATWRLAVAWIAAGDEARLQMFIAEPVLHLRHPVGQPRAVRQAAQVTLIGRVHDPGVVLGTMRDVVGDGGQPARRRTRARHMDRSRGRDQSRRTGAD